MSQFSREEVQQVLENLHTRFPHATVADAIMILEDGERADRADATDEAAEAAARDVELDDMARFA